MALSLSIADGHILIAIGDDVVESDITRRALMQGGS